MSGDSAERLLPPDVEAISGSASCRAEDRLAALLGDRAKPTAYYVDELLRVWRDAQREATDAYACWSEPAPSAGHPGYLAALDREQRAAEVYAEVARRALEWSP